MSFSLQGGRVFQTMQFPDLTVCTHCGIYTSDKSSMKCYLITGQKCFTYTHTHCMDHRRWKNPFCQWNHWFLTRSLVWMRIQQQIEKHKTILPPCFFSNLSYHPGQDLYPFSLVFWVLLSASDTEIFPALFNCLKQILSKKSQVTTSRTISFTSGMCPASALYLGSSICPAAGISKPAGHSGCQIKTW